MRPISALLTTAALAAACTLIGAAQPVAAHADGSNGPQGCYGYGRVLLSPAVTTSPKDGSVRFAQNLGPCRLADGSILSGTLSGTGSGRFSCVASRGTSQFLTRWDNGRTSSGTFDFATAGSHLGGTGTITQGEFAGDRFGFGGELDPGDPSACTSGGVSQATSYESIGVSPR
jgi:hypothetical protein